MSISRASASTQDDRGYGIQLNTWNTPTTVALLAVMPLCIVHMRLPCQLCVRDTIALLSEDLEVSILHSKAISTEQAIVVIVDITTSDIIASPVCCSGIATATRTAQLVNIRIEAFRASGLAKLHVSRYRCDTTFLCLAAHLIIR